MVIRDLSAPESSPQIHKDEVRIAFVSDRFTAAVLDFLIFSPVVSFCVAGFLKEIKTYLLLDPESFEASIIWCLFILASLGLVVFIQALFLYFWKATPGQRFMQMKVISYPRRFEELTFAQCLLRSILWALSFGLLAAPFLEVIGHPMRRSFHERASDTLVITLKENQDDGPLLLERKFVGSWLRMFFLLVFLVGGLYAFKAYRLVHQGHFAKAPTREKNLLCNQVEANVYMGAQRIDIAIALFLSDEATSECLRKEADFALWNSLESEKAWAYLAKGIISDEKMDQERYFSKACEWNKKEEPCHLTKFVAQDEDQNAKEFRRKGLSSVTSRVLLLNDMVEQHSYHSAIVLIKDLQQEKPLRASMEKQYVRSIWALNEQSKATSKMRRPASEVSDELLREFKEKYGMK